MIYLKTMKKSMISIRMLIDILIHQKRLTLNQKEAREVVVTIIIVMISVKVT